MSITETKLKQKETVIQSPAKVVQRNEDERIDLRPSIPFILIHLSCLFVFLVGFSWTAFGVCLLAYFVRMFGITAGYHRYFSHRTYKTSRVFQFILAFIGSASAQLGPLWWATHHRHHHRYSDTEEDYHSPLTRGFWWAHVGWILCPKYDTVDYNKIRDFARFPELRFIDKYHAIAPILLAVSLFFFGVLLQYTMPQLNTSGWQMLIWGFFVSTVILYHSTFSINTLTHMFGKQRFETGDKSRNSLILALATMGEGWHNNHHRYPGSEQQGFYWWEIDLSHYILKVLSWLGIVWDIRKPPESIYREAKEIKLKQSVDERFKPTL